MTTLTWREKAKFLVGGLWPVAAVIAGVVAIPFFVFNAEKNHIKEATPTPQIATVNPEVKHEEKIDVPVTTPKATIKAYTSKGKAQLVLPPYVLNDSTKVVTDSSIVASTEKRQVVTQVLDSTSGETTTFVTTAPDPWLSFENRGTVSVDVGYRRGNPEPVTRVNLREDLVQIKSVHLGLSASAYTDGDYFVGIGGSYRW